VTILKKKSFGDLLCGIYPYVAVPLRIILIFFAFHILEYFGHDHQIFLIVEISSNSCKADGTGMDLSGDLTRYEVEFVCFYQE
jgi:hypothetical protein